MKLEEISALIGDQQYPPVDKWKPDFCGDIDIRIARDGRWLHEGDEIKRPRMVRLFASIMKREGRDYFLITPVEKMRIQVESTPFVVTSAEYLENSWVLTNNLDEKILLDSEHPLNLTDPENPEVIWRSQLPARIHRNVMYQWQVYALDHGGLQGNELFLESAGERFLIAKLTE